MATCSSESIECAFETLGVTSTTKKEGPKLDGIESRWLDYMLVENEESLVTSIEIIKEAVRQDPLIAFDCEGESLSRKGNLCLMSVATRTKAYLIDVKVLKTMPFEKGLRHLLEDANIKKLMFDCRADSDALYHQFNVKLDGVLDIQLLEVIKEHSDQIGITTGKRCEMHIGVVRLKGLLKCIEVYLNDDEMVQKKTKGSGRSSDWDKRPLLPHELDYAATDVLSLFKLFEKLQPDSEEMRRLEIASGIYVDLKRSMVYRTYDEYDGHCYLPIDVIPPKGQTVFESGYLRSMCTTCKRSFPRDEFSKNQLKKRIQKCRTCKRVKEGIERQKNMDEQIEFGYGGYDFDSSEFGYGGSGYGGYDSDSSEFGYDLD